MRRRKRRKMMNEMIVKIIFFIKDMSYKIILEE